MAEAGEKRKASFLKWLSAVDEEALDEDVLQAVQGKLEASAIQDAKALRSANDDEVAAFWDGNVGVKAFLRRCVKTAKFDEGSPRKFDAPEMGQRRR